MHSQTLGSYGLQQTSINSVDQWISTRNWTPGPLERTWHSEDARRDSDHDWFPGAWFLGTVSSYSSGAGDSENGLVEHHVFPKKGMRLDHAWNPQTKCVHFIWATRSLWWSPGRHKPETNSHHRSWFDFPENSWGHSDQWTPGFYLIISMP